MALSRGEIMKPKKSDLLVEIVEHIDIKEHNVVPLVEAMSKMAFSARDLGRAAQIYDAMLRDEDCAIILCLAGSIFSAGLKNVIVDLVRHNMVERDRFHRRHYCRPGFLRSARIQTLQRRDQHGRRRAAPPRHRSHLRYLYRRRSNADLRFDLRGDRGQTRAAAHTHRASSFAKWKAFGEHAKKIETQLFSRAFEKNVPIFVPAFSDC